MMNNDIRQKLIRFLVPGKLGAGFLLGVGFMLWLAVERKTEFDEFVLFIIDFLSLTHA